jgi:HEAT repeats
MRTRRKWLWLLLGCGIVAILLFTLFREREPRYAGDTLSQWVFRLEVTSGNPDRIPIAEDAIRHMGTNALPFLIKWIQYEERPWRTRLNALCSKLPEKLADRFSYFFDGRLVVRRDGAFSALYVLGPDAAPAIPTLIHLTEIQPFTIQQPMTVLAAIGGDGLMPVLWVLNDPASPNRLAAINAIADATFEAKRPLGPIVVSALTNCLADTNRLFAITAAQILCTHGSHKELGMKTLIDALDDKKFRLTAISRLRLSLKHGYSVPALLQFLQDTNSPVSPYAAGALMDLADSGAKLPETILPALTNSLHDLRPLVRSYAADAVGHFKAAAEPAAPALLDLWTDPDESVRQSATNAFFDLPSFFCLRILTQPPTVMSQQLADMFTTRYGINPLFPAATNLLHHPDIRIRQMATNAFRMVEGSNTLNQTTEILSR